MAESEIDRKIAVIFVADVVGYSKHMEKDENATFKAYGACEKILNKLLKKYKGSIFNTAGDSVLAEFPSAVNAVECAVDFQNEIKERNASDKTETKLEFRIGINMGDVVQKDGNLLGDGVNIAARLEALAQPNGITISKSVYDLVVPKTKVTFNDLGVQKVKQNTFHAYDILLDPSQKRTLKTQSSSNTTLFAGIAAALIIAIAGFFMFNGGEDVQVAEVQETSKPVILVASVNATGLSEDQQGFANGMTESMISTFSTYKGIRVLSSSTSTHVAENNMSDEDIRNEYGVNFVVRSSMQVMGDNARLNIEVTDLKIGEVVKTEKRDFALSDIFNIQDEMSYSILGALQTDLGTGDYDRRVLARLDTMEDFTLFLNWIRIWRSYTPEGYEKSKAIVDDLKTRYSEGHPILDIMDSWQISQKILLKLSQNEEEDKDRLRFILNRLTSEHPDLSDGFNARALITLIRLGGSCEDAIADISHAEKLGGGQETLLIGAAVYNRCGERKKTIGRLRELLKIVPNDPLWFQTGFLVSALYQDEQPPEKIYEVVGDKINAEDIDPRILAIYAIFEFEKGNLDEAIKYYKRAIGNGFRKDRIEPTNEELRVKTYKILDEIESLASG